MPNKAKNNEMNNKMNKKEKAGFSKVIILIIVLVIIAGGVLAWQFWPEATDEQAPVVEQEPPVVDKIDEIQIGGVFVDVDIVKGLQQEVDEGRQPWRLEPLLVAQAESLNYGFSNNDQLELVYQSSQPEEDSDTYHAYVGITHNNELYWIQLIQPVKVGLGGIWVINNIGYGTSPEVE